MSLDCAPTFFWSHAAQGPSSGRSCHQGDDCKWKGVAKERWFVWLDLDFPSLVWFTWSTHRLANEQVLDLHRQSRLTADGSCKHHMHDVPGDTNPVTQPVSSHPKCSCSTSSYLAPAPLHHSFVLPSINHSCLCSPTWEPTNYQPHNKPLNLHPNHHTTTSTTTTPNRRPSLCPLSRPSPSPTSVALLKTTNAPPPASTNGL